MKTSTIVALLVFLAFAGGLIYFAVVDIPVEQTSVSKEISNERFSNE